LNLYNSTKIFTSKVFYDKEQKKYIFAIGFKGEGIFFYDMMHFKCLGRLLPLKQEAASNFDIIFDCKNEKFLIVTYERLIKFYI